MWFPQVKVCPERMCMWRVMQLSAELWIRSVVWILTQQATRSHEQLNITHILSCPKVKVQNLNQPLKCISKIKDPSDTLQRITNLPTHGVSPTRPSIWFNIPPVDVAQAVFPSLSTATAPTVPILPLKETDANKFTNVILTNVIK